MEVISKFRTLFLIRKAFFFSFLICLCFLFLAEGINKSDFTMTSLSIIFIFLFVFIQYINLKSLYKLVISDSGITKILLVSGKYEVIPFTDIVSVKLNHVEGLESDAGQISMGYYESIITLTNNNELLITPDYFENYRELIHALNHNNHGFS